MVILMVVLTFLVCILFEVARWRRNGCQSTRYENSIQSKKADEGKSIYIVAASDSSLDAKISKRFGQALYYLILYSEQLDFAVINGPGEHRPSYDFSHFASRDIDGIIVGNIGPQAFTNLITIGWSVYSCLGMSVREAVKMVSDGKVPALISPTINRSIRSALN